MSDAVWSENSWGIEFTQYPRHDHDTPTIIGEVSRKRPVEVARLDGAIVRNPAADVKAPPQKPRREGRALSDGELGAVLAAAEEVDPRTAGMVWLMARCGLRVGEAIGLRRSDVDLGAGTVTVSGSMTRRDGRQGPKTEAGRRTVPVPADAVARLRRHLDEQTVASLDGWLFTAARGGPIVYTRWRSRTWRRIVDRAGFDVNPHDLRHSAATRLVTVDRWLPAEVQAFLGHTDPRMALSVYTHVTAEGLPQPSTLAAAPPARPQGR